jgi:hypothetical protein
VLLSGFAGRALGGTALPDYELFSLGGFHACRATRRAN